MQTTEEATHKHTDRAPVSPKKMLDCLCPDTAQMVVAQLTSKREFKGVTSLRASSLAWKREVDAFLEEMRQQAKDAADAFRNAFIYLPLSLDNVL